MLRAKMFFLMKVRLLRFDYRCDVMYHLLSQIAEIYPVENLIAWYGANGNSEIYFSPQLQKFCLTPNKPIFNGPWTLFSKFFLQVNVVGFWIVRLFVYERINCNIPIIFSYKINFCVINKAKRKKKILLTNLSAIPRFV